jgi:uncharacterized protein YndB with AHSA1/START domain
MENTMNDSTPVATDQVVLITRIFEAPREQVFRAWTDPDQVAAWYGSDHFDTPRERILIDLRVGGRYELTMVRRDGGGEFAIGYEIVELVEPELIVLRSDPDAGAGHARAHDHARGVPRPRRQDTDDAQRRAIPRGPRPRRGRLECRLRQARVAHRQLAPRRGCADAGSARARAAPPTTAGAEMQPSAAISETMQELIGAERVSALVVAMAGDRRS